MPEKPIDIQIFGRTLRISCPSTQKEALDKAVVDLTQRLQDLKNRTRVTNVEQLVFIVALNVCHELAQEKLKTCKYAANVEKHILLLQKIIEKYLVTHTYISESSNNLLGCPDHL
ncbi:cell division protein ZapA [Candidatus Blochmannia ocreatus (nom. nud.)]|uniref:Cell division protein ZapA n=1 Tax=Candidatus Blochmannia ocreatus (nom. nud.) TaxID=251538 RepID=A0ABY4SYI1_9ENTR|nr:cell division protein ZapA [Candidatus Blochmannia ocreatus]URJ25323.1 cell division protein ZapA [Candidatus Blochmannia ocreatus]